MSLSDGSSDSSHGPIIHRPQPYPYETAQRPFEGSPFAPSPSNAVRPTASQPAIPLGFAGQSFATGLSTSVPNPPATLTQRIKSDVRRAVVSVGAEPGIDPRRASANVHYGYIHQQCDIEVIDYSPDQCSFGHMKNQQLIEMLQDSAASEREPWANVRWINIGGISWDVISAMALRYDMHPLAIEDLIHQHGRARSKADYYPKHLFMRILCHRLAPDDDMSLDASLGHVPLDPSAIPRTASPEPMDMDHYDEKGLESMDEGRTMHNSPGVGAKDKGIGARDVESSPADRPVRPRPVARHSSWSSTLLHFAKKKQQHAADWKLIQKLKRGERINVKLNPISIFLFRDGTVISISQDPEVDFTAPIRDRLRQSDTSLRMTADPSLLVESLIDLIVDQALVVVEEYQGKILKIEKAVLLKPDMKTVTSLHMLQEDLILHKRTLEPIKTLVNGLRRYDADRAAAIALKEDFGQDSAIRPAGFMSDKARIYLADVYDHLEYILNSLDMFASVSDNLINYTCNMVSYQMNEVMRRLTLITMIFLPLSFLSGYFGMNFSMWSTGKHTDVFYWEVSLPVMVVLLPMFMMPDLKRMWHYAEKRVIKLHVNKDAQ